MKKGILCILLSFLLLVPMLTSCQKEADYSEKKASIYTLYTIVDDSTTPEAVRQVELALNRIVFYRLGVILKLEMVTEDKYDELIKDKFAEMEAYQLKKKNNKKDKSSAAASSEETSEEIMSGDRILQMLEEGKDIELENPRLDIFLVRGYDNYYKLASEGKLTALDEKLNNEAKALKSSIHSTLFTAAKVNNKTYGVPVNNAIGEYTYLVFDKELLEQHKVDPNTIHTLEDLQGYLELIKTNNPDVVPLKNTNPSTSIDFLSNDGFPAMITSAKEVVESYDNKNLLGFLSVIARYNALGYLGSADSDDESSRYAVRIESGNIDDIGKRLEGTDREYSYSLYSNPIATNENTIDNIFCVSKYVVSNELTDVVKVLTALNTDDQLMNILTYGVENEHYILTDEGQVDRLNDNYMIDPNNAGNCFITYTLKNENPDKWKNAIKQNQDAIVSPSLGYTIGLTSFDYKEKQEITDEETGKVTVQEIEHTVNEPDYIKVINKVVDKYYPALMNGTAVEFDYTALYAEAEKAIVDEIKAAQDERYEENILKPMLSENIREDIIKRRGKELLREAEKTILGDLRDKITKSLKNRLSSSFKTDNPDATDDEIDRMVTEALTDELIDTTLHETYSDEDLNEHIETQYLIDLENEVSAATADLEGTASYTRELNKLKNSSKYKQELAEMIEKNAPRKIEKAIDGKISEIIADYTAAMKEEMNTEIQNAVDAFISENSETLGLSRDEMLSKMGYLKEAGSNGEGDETAESSSASESSESSEGEGEKAELVEAYKSWFEFVFEEKFVKVYYGIFGKPKAGA